MNTLYIIFAAIPLLAVLAAFLPELTGKTEPVPVGGFEYSIFAPRRYLIGGAFGIGACGILMLLLLDGVFDLADQRIAIALLAVFLVGEAISLFAVIHYFSYRLTVRGGVIFYKLALRRELCVKVSDVDAYSARMAPNSRVSLIIYVKNRKILAEGDGAELLLSELEQKNIKKK